MKYTKESVVDARYTNANGNPFLEALPEFMEKKKFMEFIKSEIYFPHNLLKKQPAERRVCLTELTKWFLPMDYMYCIYDMLYKAIVTTYQTKTTVKSIRQIYDIYTDFRTGAERKITYATQAYSGAILGVPGIGKTSTIQRCLETIPQVIVHKEYQNNKYYSKQVNYLIAECPSDCSIKTLAFNIILGIDRAIGSNYIENGNVLKSLSSSAITAKLKIVCMSHHVGLIVIDEIQNAVVTATRNKQIKPLIKFLVELTNETSTSICFCGTLESEELFLKKEHLKRRTRGLRLLPMKYDYTYRQFLSTLWKFQVTVQSLDLTEKLMKQVYDLSGGIPAYIIKIFIESQNQAILCGNEKLTYEIMKQTVSILGIDVPRVYSRGGTSISDFTVDEISMEEITPIEENIFEENHDVEFIVESRKSNMEYMSSPQLEIVVDVASEVTTKPITRFYATKRGRKRAERDNSDLIVLWNQTEEPNCLISLLESHNMLERRWY